MSIEATLERIGALRQTMSDPASLIGAGVASTGGTAAPSALAPTTELGPSAEPSFDAALRLAGSNVPVSIYPGPSSVAPVLPGPTSSGTSPLVAIAESQLGQAEQPPGSNESPAIAEYRTATAGAQPGAPWCAYFASWVARQAGEPIGPGGQGAGSVGEVWSWAQSAGRAIPNGPGVVPKPGDLIVFGDEHVGIVRGILPDGSVQTIEGNYENRVAPNVRSPGEATGYVSMS
jgi:cell wall-associated NlpC family hydrolase